MTHQITVPFHGANLIVIEHNNQAYVPMKQIVEGMGLAWGSQLNKLNGNQERWGVSLIDIPSVDTNNKLTCLPLRKLFGWLNTIQPSRVRADIRDKVIQYQNECDDVLHDYWMNLTQPQQPQTQVIEVAKPSRRLQMQTYLSQLAYLRNTTIQTIEQELNQKLNTSIHGGDETQFALINAHLKLLVREEEKKTSPQARQLQQQACANGMKVVSQSELDTMRYQLEQQQEQIEKMSNVVIAMSRKNQELIHSQLFK